MAAAPPPFEPTSGDSDARGLVPRLHEELRVIARAYMRGERSDHTLQPTALVNEAYLRLVGDAGLRWGTRTQFLAVAAQMMRRILVEHARGRGARKRGGDWSRVPLEAPAAELALPDLALLDLEDALEALSALDARAGRVVELRFFGGLDLGEIADVLGVSKRTAEGDWYMARAWLRDRLADTP
jgi:RNA polymerase sigma factor (TIGR02999 family)